MKVPLREAVPIRTWRRQAKAKLAAPSMSFEGQTILLVGATGVILTEAARIIADCHVTTLVFGVRDLKKGEALANELRKKHSQLNVTVLGIDLLSFTSVRSFVEAINKLGRIDAIVMGAALMNLDTKITEDGWEETLQLVHLASALLVMLLLPKIRADGEEHPVILSSVTSSAIRTSAPMIKLPAKSEESYIKQLNSVPNAEFQKNYQYGVCKVTHACWIRQIGSYLPSDRVHLHLQDPGACFSPLSSEIKSAQILLKLISRPVQMCARTVVNSCTPVKNSHGRLLIDYDVVNYPKYMDRPDGLELRQRVWDETKDILIAACPEMEAAFATLSELGV